MDSQTPNPHELLDQVNRFEQLTQAEQARDLFSEMSQLLEHDGKNLMADFVMYVSECYDIIPTPEETKSAAHCALIILPEELRPIMNDLAGQNPALAIP